MRYLLDTNICIYLINRRPGFDEIIRRRLKRLSYGDVFISAITLCELEHGIANSTRRDHNRQRVEHFLAHFETADFDDAAARAYGPLRARLEKAGRPIGPLDTLIAAHALALGTALVTNDTDEFSRVPGLRLENWTLMD